MKVWKYTILILIEVLVHSALCTVYIIPIQCINIRTLCIIVIVTVCHLPCRRVVIDLLQYSYTLHQRTFRDEH